MITIRKANTKDIQTLWIFEKENRIFDRKVLGKTFKEFFLWDINKQEEQIWKRTVQKDLKKQNHLFLIAQDKTHVGYTWGYYNKQKQGYINELFVKEKARGRKISSQLMQQMSDWFKERKVKNISLNVFAANKHAIKIYKKWGFVAFNIYMKKKLK